MKNDFIIPAWLLMLVAPAGLMGQSSFDHPTAVRQAIYFDVSPPLTEMILKQPGAEPQGLKEIENRFDDENMPGNVPKSFVYGSDPALQGFNGDFTPLSPGPVYNFEAMYNTCGCYPPDTQGDVSLDHYVQVVNQSLAVYSKSGTLLFGPANLSTIWAGIPAPWNGRSDGDPVVLYDHAANRWLISQFALPASNTEFAELVAVSVTSNPMGSWYRYVLPFGTQMPDYPKFGVWHDGYYLSFNQFTGAATWNGVGACALERQKMLAGDPSARMIYFNLGADCISRSNLPSDWDGAIPPLPGEPNYFLYYDDWTPGPNYFLRIFEFHTNWDLPDLSTFTPEQSLIVTPFKSEICAGKSQFCIPQPGTTVKLATLAKNMMFRLQYRNFGTYRAMVTNHTVDADNTSHAGIRWYELRNSGSGWNVYQQGTYAPDAHHRWMGSIAMNAVGDIALGYSVSSTSLYPSIRYTGRRASDPAGTLSVAEQTVITGSGSQTGTAARWGDYSMMSVDPSDDNLFYYTTEYIQVTGTANWKTRVAAFRFTSQPVVVTLPATAVGLTSATLNGTVNPNGLSTTYRFDWGYSTAYGNSTSWFLAGAGTSNVSVSYMPGVVTGQIYHYRLVAVNSAGPTFGADMTFLPGGAVVTTREPAYLSLTSARSGGTITIDGGSAVTARGVCWSMSPNPTIVVNHTHDGTGTGTFTSTLTGLAANTLYHVRAYATNGTNHYYGEDMVLCGAFTYPFSENFSTTSLPGCWSLFDLEAIGQGWSFGTITGYGTSNPALTGNYAYLNSDAYGDGYTQDADLITPPLNLSYFSSVTLQFRHFFRAWSGSYATLYYSIDNGVTWNMIQQFSATTTNPALFSQAIPAVAGKSQVKFRWNYYGYYGYYWAVDEVQVTGTVPANADVSNKTLTDGQSECYNATQVITVAANGPFIVQNGGMATLIAGQKIRLLTGTKVQNGGYLRGRITTTGQFCTTTTVKEEVSAEGPSAGIAAEAPFSTISVYPNPSDGKFTLRLPDLEPDTPVDVRILDIVGKEMLSRSYPGSRLVEISAGELPSGIYLVRIEFNGQVVTRKMVVDR